MPDPNGQPVPLTAAEGTRLAHPPGGEFADEIAALHEQYGREYVIDAFRDDRGRPVFTAVCRDAGEHDEHLEAPDGPGLLLAMRADYDARSLRRLCPDGAQPPPS